MESTPMSELFLQLEQNLCSKLEAIEFKPQVEFIYNPINYACDIHSKFLSKYCTSTKEILFLGMNPGPWGMMQNGVPFGESGSVQTFLGLSGVVNKPEKEHPSRPVLGLSCHRSEVSGKRFWSLASSLGGGEAARFFQHSFVYNYFPLCLLSSQGKNITPPELKVETRKEIELACDLTLLEVLRLLKTKVVIAVGRFAEKKVQTVIKEGGVGVKVVCIPHPSPRNPASNQDWLATVRQLIIDYDLDQYFTI